MVSLIIRIKKIFHSNKGETLMEAIVSIILLTILLTTITAMISISQRMTANAIRQANNTQARAFNAIILKDDDIFNDAIISFTPALNSDLTFVDITSDISHSIKLFDIDLFTLEYPGDENIELINSAIGIVSFWID